MLSPYWPGSSRVAGKLNRPLSSVGTLTVTVEPTFLALTTTPSMAPSLSDVTRPVSAALCAKADADNNRQDTNRPEATTIALRRMTISLDASLLLVERKHRLWRAPRQSGGPGLMRGRDGYAPRRPARQPISQKSVSSRVASLKIVTSSASRAGVT